MLFLQKNFCWNKPRKQKRLIKFLGGYRLEDGRQQGRQGSFHPGRILWLFLLLWSLHSFPTPLSSGTAALSQPHISGTISLRLPCESGWPCYPPTAAQLPTLHPTFSNICHMTKEPRASEERLEFASGKETARGPMPMTEPARRYLPGPPSFFHGI